MKYVDAKPPIDIIISSFIYLKKILMIAKRLLIQGVSRLQGIAAGGDFVGFCDQKSTYKHVSDFGRLRSYGRFLIPVHALV